MSKSGDLNSEPYPRGGSFCASIALLKSFPYLAKTQIFFAAASSDISNENYGFAGAAQGMLIILLIVSRLSVGQVRGMLNKSGEKIELEGLISRGRVKFPVGNCWY